MNYDAISHIPEEKREAILRISTEEFARHGYTAASTNSITGRAGISKGSLFYYFGNKKGLYLYILNDIIDSFLSQIERESKCIKGYLLYDNVKNLFLAKASFFISHELEFDFLIRANQDPNDEIRPEVQKLYMKLYTGMLEQRLELVRQSIDELRLRDGISFDIALDCIMLGIDALTLKFTTICRNYKKELLQTPDKLLSEARIFLEVISHGIYKENTD